MNTVDAIENSSAILLSCDKNGTILVHEGGGLKSHNIKPKQYVGYNIFEVFSYLPEYLKAVKIALNGQPAQTVYKWGANYCETHLTPQVNGGFIGICTIQTARILREKDNDLETRISAKKDAKRDFLAIVSHELRTPLSGLIGIIHLMKDENIENDTFLETLDKTANKLMMLVNDLLDYSKIKKNKISIQNINCNINELIIDTINLFTPLKI